jgi:hypothetical protein
MLKRILYSALFVVIAIILYLNIRLYYQPQWSSTAPQTNLSVEAQLNYLQKRMHAGAAVDMQKRYPEGYLFLNALYGLSWCNLLAKTQVQSPLYKQGIEEVRWALQAIDTPAGLAPFSPNLPLAYGAFYQGWSNYLRGKYLGLLPNMMEDTTQARIFQDNCAQIAKAVAESKTPFLESYIYATWPADMVVLMASLAQHDRLFRPQYGVLTQKWLKQVDKRTDQLGMIPHSVHSYTGKVLEAARGSSQSLILNFLIEIDSTYAHRHFERYKKAFLARRTGLPGIREYPKGTLGFGDVDSGPVIFGIGGAASIVGQRTMALYGEADVAVGLRNCIETFGLGWHWGKEKCYLFGALPIADAFIAWANSVEASKEERLVGRRNWRWSFQLALVVVLVGVGMMWGMRPRR